jgi:hypothetical protein
MAKLSRTRLINAEYLDETEETQEYDTLEYDNENSVTKHIFELKDLLSYDILKQELIDSLDVDGKPLFLEPNSRNIVRIFYENINNLYLENSEDKFYLDRFKEEIRQIVLAHLEENYKITYNINEAEEFIDLEPIADLYEFFVLRKLNNIFKYYYSIINMSFFDKIITDDQERKEATQELKQYLISINEKLLIGEEDISDNEITMELLSDFFNNRFKIVNSEIMTIIGMSSFLNFIVSHDDGEIVSDRVREMFYNFGGFGGIEFDDGESFRNYFECLIELENANELLVILASKVFEAQNQE